MRKICITVIILCLMILSSCSSANTAAQYEGKILDLENKNKTLTEEIIELKNANEILVNKVKKLEEDNEELQKEIYSFQETLQEKKNFIISQEPEKTEKLLEQLIEINLNKYKDDKGYKISAGKPLAGINLSAYIGVEYNVPAELGDNEFAYVVKIEALNDDNSKVLSGNRLALYYKSDDEDTVFYLHIESYSSISPESKTSDAEDERTRQIYQLFEEIFEPALIDHFTLPSLYLNNHTCTFSNGTMEKVYVGGGGYEAFHYIFLGE